MGSQQIDCPLCCDKTFDSKQALFDHLNNVMDNLYCPFCNIKWPTLEGLTEHLSLYDCQTVQNDTVQNIVIYEQGIHVANLENSEDIKDNDIKALTNVTELNTADSGTQYIMGESYECQDGTEVNKMYVDLMTGKQISKSGNDTELKLIKNEGESCYMIVTQGSGELQSDNTTTIVTKQNDDGTISLTAVKEPKEADTLIAPESAAGDSQVATYSCNACKVSFTSVMDHIENYHSDQEVVLEDIATPEDQNEVSMAYNTMETEEGSVSNDKLAPRRVITDTGDIVEEPVTLKTESTEVSPETLEADGFYHKVMIKEVHTKTGFTVKMYHCMSCNVTVNNLDEFQTRPCKTMKYPCPRCTAVYENSKSLCAHMKVHKQRPDDKLSAAVSHECEICCTEFPTAKSLKLHKRMHEPKSRAPVEIKDGTQVLYRCNICELTVPFDQRTIHDNSHKTSDNTTCGVCNKKFHSIEYLNMHMKTHNGEKVTVEKQDKSFVIYSKKLVNEKVKTERISNDGKLQEPVTYECEVCCTVFSSNKSLKLHKRMHDPVKSRPIELPVENTSKDGTQTLYRCNICEKMIPFDYRTIHENSHTTSDRMNCGICNKKFSSIEYLEMHMNVHNLDKVPVNKQDKSLPYKCLYCNRRFARPHEKVKHERIHTGEKPHSCEICGKSFRVSYCLTLHMRTHTGARPYACPHCGKRFKAHSVYNHHLLTHSEVRAYKCPYCPKAFKTSVQLAGHKNSHTKPFACQHCNRPFASLYAVRVHTETHSRLNNLKFSCALCGASYARAFALKDHIKDVHSKDREIAEKLLENNQDEEWMSRDNTTDTETLNKELQQDINEFGITANELIVP